MKKNIALIAMIAILVLAAIGNVVEVINSMNNAVAVNWAPFTAIYAVLTIGFSVIARNKKDN